MALQRRSRARVAARARDRGPLAAVIAARRQELALSQVDLAGLAGVSRGSVVSVEAGRSISVDGLLALLAVLGLHLEVARGATSGGFGVRSDLAAQYGLDKDVEETRD